MINKKLHRPFLSDRQSYKNGARLFFERDIQFNPPLKKKIESKEYNNCSHNLLQSNRKGCRAFQYLIVGVHAWQI